MGNAVGVIAPPPDKMVVIKHQSQVAMMHARHTAVSAQDGFMHVWHLAERWYGIVDDKVISRVHRSVEKHVLQRISRFVDHVEVMSKILFVKAISTTCIAEAYQIDVEESVSYVMQCQHMFSYRLTNVLFGCSVERIEIGKRQYKVYNCGPELLNVPTLHKNAPILELRDRQVIGFLLQKCMWTVWQPPTSWRMKVDQLYDLKIHVNVRINGFLTGEVRMVKLRVGRKWVGAHHHNSGAKDGGSAMDHAMKSKWLHCTNYEVGENQHMAENEFFQTVQLAWQQLLEELAKLPKEDLRASDETGNGFPYDEQDQQTSLRIKYLLETSLETVLNDKRTLFRSSDQFEQWRMEQEDDIKHRLLPLENHFAGPLLEANLEELVQLYESKAMLMEDIKILDF